MSKDSATPLPRHLPLEFQPSSKLGAGKDNRVYGLYPESAHKNVDPEVAERAGNLVVKAGNPREKGVEYTAETAVDDAKFKRDKYHLLRHFLGSYIPESHFIVGQQRNPDGRYVVRPYTIQQRVPQFTLKDLSPEERNSDVLRGEMYGLARRMQGMHRTLNRARSITETRNDTFLVDAALDLGPFSDFIREHTDEDPSYFNYGDMIGGYKGSPNLLVDPDTLKLSCVDFGAGRWSDQLGTQLALVYDIAAYDPDINTQLPKS